jgi:cold shock CspA family protein
MTTRLSGTIIHFSHEKRFGFIRPDAGGDNLFFHESCLPSESGEPMKGDKCTFEVGSNRKGPAAIEVELEEEQVETIA